jgi:hypothetical protein
MYSSARTSSAPIIQYGAPWASASRHYEGKRCGHGFRTFEQYRLRVPLHAGGVSWPSRPRRPRIRTRAPYSNALS